MAQNIKTSNIIKKFGTYEMCNTPDELKRWRDGGSLAEPCNSVVHSGVIGCGKSTTIAQAFGLWCLEAQARGLVGLRIVIAGVSQKRVKENFCNALIKVWGAGENGYHETHSSKVGYRDGELFGQWLYIIDLHDKGAEERIRGLSDVTGIIIEELTLIEEEKYLMLLGRMRGSLTPEQQRLWPDNWMRHWVVSSTNPDGPTHWILKHVKDGRMKLIPWGMQDACYPDAKASYKHWIELYRDTPVIYKRNLLGLWVGNDKAVYTAFNLKRHTYSDNEYDISLRDMKRVFIAVDAGSSHPTAALLICKTFSGEYVVCDAMRIQHTAPSEIVRAIGIWYDTITDIFGSALVIYDSAAAWLKDEMLKFGLNCMGAKKDVVVGINFVRGLLGGDALLINRDKCPDLVSEMSSYSFKNEERDDVVKVEDDFVDALRYGVYTDYIMNDGGAV